MELPEGFTTPPNHTQFIAKKLFGAAEEIIDGAIAQIAPTGGGPIQPHTHPHDHLFIVISGEATLQIENEIKTLRPNESYLVPGNRPHSVWNRGTTTTTMIGINVRVTE